jgi:hypothetical protein
VAQSAVANSIDVPESKYFLPCEVVLKGLGINELDLQRMTATVNVRYLQRLLQEIAKYQPFDAQFYSKRYPDIEGARLAGEIQSVHSHFVQTGYLEGRLPCDLPFDPKWYYEHYKDLSRLYAADDVEGLRRHFFNTGYIEGRAGTRNTLEVAERWFVD